MVTEQEHEQAQKEFFNNEWKKMYVASTRARQSLYLSFPTTISRKGYIFHKLPSRFIQNVQTTIQ